MYIMTFMSYRIGVPFWSVSFEIEQPVVVPDEGFEAGASDRFRDVREELQAELTQGVILLLQGQQHQVGTSAVKGHSG